MGFSVILGLQQGGDRGGPRAWEGSRWAAASTVDVDENGWPARVMEVAQTP